MCLYAACTATPRTVTSTYTHGFLTAVPGYADSITYHPNGQVNTVRHLNDPANSATWVTDRAATPLTIGEGLYDIRVLGYCGFPD